jgi:hypothetical protein
MLGWIVVDQVGEADSCMVEARFDGRIRIQLIGYEANKRRHSGVNLKYSSTSLDFIGTLCRFHSICPSFFVREEPPQISKFNANVILPPYARHRFRARNIYEQYKNVIRPQAAGRRAAKYNVHCPKPNHKTSAYPSSS